MKLSELIQYHGRTAVLLDRATPGFEKKAGLRPRVRITDARLAFGRVDLLVSPTDGEGSAWVSLTNVRLDPIVKAAVAA